MCPHFIAVSTDTLKAYTTHAGYLNTRRMLVLNVFTVVTILVIYYFISRTGVSVWLSALGPATYFWCICQLAIKLYCIVLYCIVLHCIVLYCIVLYCIALHCIVLYCIALHCIVLYCIVLHCIVLYCIVLYCKALGW